MTAIIATAIRKASDRLGDQGKLAAALGMNRGNLSDWKNGHVERFDLEKLVALFDAAEMSLAALQGLGEEPEGKLLSEIAAGVKRIEARISGGYVIAPDLPESIQVHVGEEVKGRVRSRPLPKNAENASTKSRRRKAE